MRKTACDIHNHILENTGRAILANDFEAFAPWFRLPNEIETFVGRRRITNREELAQVFQAVRVHFQKIGVTDIVRRCLEASFEDDRTIIAMHETRLLSGNTLQRPPYPTLAVLKFTGEGWQVASNSYAVDDTFAHSSALLSAGEVCATGKTPYRDL